VSSRITLPRSFVAEAFEIIVGAGGKVGQATFEERDGRFTDLVSGNNDGNAFANQIRFAAPLEPGGPGKTKLLIAREIDGGLLHATHHTIRLLPFRLGP